MRAREIICCKDYLDFIALEIAEIYPCRCARIRGLIFAHEQTGQIAMELR
jgi:hypothetical protein